MFSYKLKISEKEHDDFVKNSPQVNLLQSSKWAKIKNTWKNERIGFFKDEKLVAVAMILTKPLPLGRTMIYIPRGPIMDYSDEDLVKFVLKSLKEIGKNKKALFVKFDPMLHLKQFDIDKNDTPENEKTLSAIGILEKNGAIWKGRTSDMAATIQPRFQANIYAEGFSIESVSKSQRRFIRTSKDKFITTIFGGTELLPEFSRIMKKTEERKNISLRSENYYKKLLETYAGDSYICLVVLDAKSRLNSIIEQKQKLEERQKLFTSKTQPSKIKEVEKELTLIEDEIPFLKQKIAECGETLYLAGTLTIEFGKTSECLYVGLDNDYQRYRPAPLSWFDSAVHAFERGVEWFNMGGLENNLSGGLYNFKAKFNPKVEEFVGEFDLPVTPLYSAVNTAYKLRKKIKKRK